jgi:hypothetical protein
VSKRPRLNVEGTAQDREIFLLNVKRSQLDFEDPLESLGGADHSIR